MTSLTLPLPGGDVVEDVPPEGGLGIVGLIEREGVPHALLRRVPVVRPQQPRRRSARACRLALRFSRRRRFRRYHARRRALAGSPSWRGDRLGPLDAPGLAVAGRRSRAPATGVSRG